MSGCFFPPHISKNVIGKHHLQMANTNIGITPCKKTLYHYFYFFPALRNGMLRASAQQFETRIHRMSADSQMTN